MALSLMEILNLTIGNPKPWRKKVPMKIKSFSISSLYLTIASIILVFIGNYFFKEDNITFMSMGPYLISFVSAVTALFFSIKGFYEKEKYKYLGLFTFIYAASCLSFFIYILNH